ncbi:hypothetical protein OPIT5_03325 [Opitutaceae bacterium TAV5]|nr:hypothetical protein OPIT5_03325 [Opitutaceae bacterium TAV5]
MKLPQVIRRIVPFFVVAAVAAVAQPVPGGAEGSKKTVEVSNVRFNKVRGPGSSDQWLESEVELNVKAPGSGSDRFLNRVRVTLNLAVEVTPAPKDGPAIQLYRSSAEAVALENGRSWVRFYLPPEIVKRDGVPANPKYYLVSLAVDGAEVPREALGRAAISSGLPNAETFMTEIAGKAGANDGLLQPQYLTPFLTDSSKKTSTFIRREQL